MFNHCCGGVFCKEIGVYLPFKEGVSSVSAFQQWCICSFSPKLRVCWSRRLRWSRPVVWRASETESRWPDSTRKYICSLRPIPLPHFFSVRDLFHVKIHFISPMHGPVIQILCSIFRKHFSYRKFSRFFQIRMSSLFLVIEWVTECVIEAWIQCI